MLSRYLTSILHVITSWNWNARNSIMLSIWYVKRHYSSLVTRWLLLEASLLLMTCVRDRSTRENAACIVTSTSVYQLCVWWHVSIVVICTEFIVYAFRCYHYSNTTIMPLSSWTNCHILADLQTIFEHWSSIWLASISLAFASTLTSISGFPQVLQFSGIAGKLWIQNNLLTIILVNCAVTINLKHLIAPFAPWCSHRCTLVNNLRLPFTNDLLLLVSHEIIHFHMLNWQS